MQERQEMAKVIGEISENAINIATYEEREKINKLGLEKFKLEEQEKALRGQAGNEQQLAAIKQQLTSVQAEITKTQGEIDRTYGIGSERHGDSRCDSRITSGGTKRYRRQSCRTGFALSQSKNPRDDGRRHGKRQSD